MARAQKPIAITDLEFTGLDPLRHEIIEIGLIVVDPQSLTELRRFEVKVLPEHIENAMPEALVVAGYKENEWKDALPLHDALLKYLDAAGNSVFAAWCTPYDWVFFLEALKKTKLQNPFGHRTIDIFGIAYEKFRNERDVESMGLSGLAGYLGIGKEPMPHRAINGAECALNIYRKLRAME